jgi:hypothetical protein
MAFYLCYMDRTYRTHCDGSCCGINPDGSPVRADESGRREYEARMGMSDEPVRRITYPDGTTVEGPYAP